jgi:endonuclease/exonuclease/phosphatase family metal-dependent hydrolase
MRRLRVASYNVHRCIGTDGRHDPDRVVRVLDELEADVIALQEVDCRYHVADGLDQLAHLSKRTGLTPVYAPVLRNHRGHYGNAVLTRYRVVQSRTIDLRVPGREPRGALDVEIDIRGRRVRVVAAHLGLRPHERRRQVRRLLRHLHHERERPVIVLGDFNEWLPTGRPLRDLHDHFGRAPAQRTFPSRFPLFALDRIWVQPAHALESVSVHATPSARVASDLLPVHGVIRGL